MRLKSLLLLGFCLAISHYSLANTTKNNARIDKKQAMKIAKKNTKGKILKITEQQKHFVIRILKPQGRVFDMKISKFTGQINKDKK